MSQKEIKTGNGTITCVQCGRVFAKKYTGTFIISSLSDKAATGLWYSGIEGDPYAIQGEGHTPLEAFEDSIARTKEHIAKLTASIVSLVEGIELLASN